MPGFFERLAADERPIALDCDVVAGLWTSRADVDGSPEAITAILRRGGIVNALVASAQACWYDEAGGAEQLKAWSQAHDWHRCNAVNLHDAIGIEDRLDAWLEDGVRAIRIGSTTQNVAPGRPGYQRIVDTAASRGMVMLVEGLFSQVHMFFRGRGAKVVFLDATYYEMADFLLIAQEEPGFVTSTRKMLGPDAFETVCGEVGASHIAFGSGSPLQDLEPTVWRLRGARLSSEDFEAVAGGTLRSLLEPGS